MAGQAHDGVNAHRLVGQCRNEFPPKAVTGTAIQAHFLEQPTEKPRNAIRGKASKLGFLGGKQALLGTDDGHALQVGGKLFG